MAWLAQRLNWSRTAQLPRRSRRPVPLAIEAAEARTYLAATTFTVEGNDSSNVLQSDSASGSAASATETEAYVLKEVSASIGQTLQNFAQSSEFVAHMQAAFGPAVTASTAQEFANRWIAKSIDLPEITIVDASVLGKASGAYAASTDTIYLSSRLMEALNDPANVATLGRVVLEEYGHSIDTRINSHDAPGDEGFIFAGFAEGANFAAQELQALRQFDDHAFIEIGEQVIEVEQSVITGGGGQGGTTDSIALSAPLNLVRFSWQNYGIPDEFQILYQGKRIAGDIGLQSGGQQGTKVVAAASSSESLTVKVTAPLEGTAWDFVVEVIPFELNVSGQLGDVIKIDIAKLLTQSGVSLADAGFDANGFGLKSTSNSRGKVAQTDTYQSDLSKGLFYFVPTVAGTALDYGASRSDVGIGDSELIVTNGSEEFAVKFHVTDNFSSTGDNIVTFGNKKLDIYRQQQRLAYLGFPGAAGNPLVVDGVAGGNTEWAQKLFNIATNPAAIRGSVSSQGTQYFKQYINNAAAPQWNRLSNISNVSIFSANQRFFGIDATGRLLEDVAAGISLVSTGSANSQGTAPPSTSHDGGRGVDIDNIPGPYLFKTVAFRGVAYVAAPGGKIVVRDGASYRAGDVNVAADRALGLQANTLNSSADKTLATTLHSLDLLDYSQSEGDVRGLLDAFLAAGATVVLYNDPRFINDSTIRFYSGHFNHMHFGVPHPVTQGSSLQLASSGMSLGGSDNTFFAVMQSAAAPVLPSGTIDLGRLESNLTAAGSLDAANRERIYRFEIGDLANVSDERQFFDTLRDLSAALSGLTANADLQLIIDLNEDGVLAPEEVLFDSSTAGTTNETILASGLGTGAYYLRVFNDAGDTSFDLSLSLAPLAVPADNAGNTSANAANLGTLTGTVTRNDFIGEVDSDDFYRLQLSQMSDIDLRVDGLSQGDLTLTLAYDANLDGNIDEAEILNFSDAEGEGSESLHFDRLSAGTYFVRISRVSGNTGYDLELIAAPSTLPPDQAGDTPATARNLGNLTTAVALNDFVGSIDPTDLYRFTIPDLKSVAIELSGLTADADLEIGRDANSDGVLESSEILKGSWSGGETSEVIELGGLKPGEYLVRVSQFDGDTNYDLSLRPGNPFGADLVVTRSNFGPASDLGTDFTYTLTVTNNGPEAAANVTLTETLFNGLFVINVVGPPTSNVYWGSNQIVANIPTLAVGESAVFNITLRSFITGDLLAEATVASDTIDFDLTNTTDLGIKPVDPIVSPDADLELTQTVSNDNPNIGDQVTFTLNLTNQGPGTATVIQVKDVLPSGLAFVSSSATLGTYDSTTGIWAVGNLPPNVSVQLQIVARVDSGASLVNTAEVFKVDEQDPDSTPNNNQSTEDDQASVTLTVIGGNQPPTAFDIDVTTREDTPLRNGRLWAFDADGTPLTFQIVDAPKHGTVNLTPDGKFEYFPSRNYFGPDEFTFRVTDGELESNVAKVKITVVAVNDAPEAFNISVETMEDVPLNGGRLWGFDLEGAALSYALVGQAPQGTVTVTPQGGFRYVPKLNFSGVDRFTFQVSDGNLTSNVATVEIQVTPVDDAPVAYDLDLFTPVNRDLHGRVWGWDPEAAPLRYELVDTTTRGRLSFDAAGNFVYRPFLFYSGTDSFTFRVWDGRQYSNSARITLRVGRRA